MFALLLTSSLAVQAAVAPPAIQREFRGAWIATVGNINWPSKPGLPVTQQKAELLAMLDRAVELRLNAIIFQARPAAEVLYESTKEPWSEYLTGQLGKAPEPAYDPLAMVIAQAHKRGLELHAWFNPFRVRLPSAKSPLTANHLAKSQPGWVRTYGNQLWLDPGEAKARAFAIEVILDVVQRYDVDGIHIDDYFYPYPEKDAKGALIPFPDGTTWKRYQDAGGKLPIADWRRGNVNQFVEQLHAGVKARKRWVKVGISPFGIWRPGHPASVKGMDAYAVLYADAKLWLEKGWCDYLAPQIYWTIDAPAQSYPVLLKWWVEQSVEKRHVWPGNFVAKVTPGGWKPEEIVNQVNLTRKEPGATGNIHFGWRAMTAGNLGATLREQVYQEPALVPPLPWLDDQPPGQPQVRVQRDATANTTITWSPTGGERVWQWTVQVSRGGRWQTQILAGDKTLLLLNDSAKGAEWVAVAAVDRCGNASLPTVLDLTKSVTAKQP